MNYLFLLLVTLAQFFTGFYILSKSSINLNRLQMVSLSIITGIGVTSLIPLILQLLYIPLTTGIIFSCIGLTAILAVITSYKKLTQISFTRYNIELYEWPWIAIMGAMVYLAVCNAIYVPATARDLLCGPEPIAHFALTEHTFINSVFQQDMPMNNGPFKSLYIPSLQLIYKLIGFTFGKVWVVILSTTFLIFLYSTVRAMVHPVFAGALAVLFLFIPELYAYTYLVLYDYSNMVYFFLSLFFLKEYLHKGHKKAMILTTLFMAIAVYIRPETLILTAMISIYALILLSLNKRRNLKAFMPVIIFVTVAGITYFISSNIYLNYYLPVHYSVSDEINHNLIDITPIFQRLNDMTFELIFTNWGVAHYGYLLVIFSILSAAELVVYKKFSKDSAYWLSLFLVTYLGIAVIGYILPLADLFNSTKRALFKVMPIAVIYISSNRLLLAASAWIAKHADNKAISNNKKIKKHGQQHAHS